MLEALEYELDKNDGFFDEETEAAVKAFQKDNKLEETGVIEGETTVKLMEALREKLLENDTQIKKAIEVLKEEMKK